MKSPHLLALGAAAVLVACGGGGDGDGAPADDTTANAQGLYTGTAPNGRTITSLVLSDGRYYMVYSGVNDPATVAGVLQGTGKANGTTFTSTDTLDFSLEGLVVLRATLSATVVPKQSINGTIAYTGGPSGGFNGAYNADYESKPSLATLAGTFSGRNGSGAGVQNATFTVAATGALSGNSNGCATTGTVTPRTDGNAYDFAITFGAAPCHFAGQTLAGVAYYNATNRRLTAFAPTATRNDGVIFVGIKP